jgi:drug/metabolite transporter (DMT)-like permease
MIFLGEQLRPFHLAGFATILFGVVLATRPRKL